MRILLFTAFVAAALVVSMPATGHNLELTRVLMLLRVNGTYQVDMICDLDALALGVSATTDSAELVAQLRQLDEESLSKAIGRLRRTFERRVRVRFDGVPVTARVSFPEYGNAIAEETEHPTVLGLTARLEGRIPEEVAEVTFSASRAFPPVYLTILHEGSLAGRRQLLEAGAPSEPYPLDGQVEPEGDADARLGDWSERTVSLSLVATVVLAALVLGLLAAGIYRANTKARGG